MIAFAILSETLTRSPKILLSASDGCLIRNPVAHFCTSCKIPMLAMGPIVITRILSDQRLLHIAHCQKSSSSSSMFSTERKMLVFP